MLLAAVLSFLLIAPGSYLNQSSRLAACCRTHGVHQCAMGGTGAHTDESGAGVRALCPFTNHHAVSSSGADRVSLPPVSLALFAGFPSHPSVRPQVEAAARVSWLRSCHKRGPPALLS
jgi:hypothetical protein